MPFPQAPPNIQVQEAEIVNIFTKERRLTVRYSSGLKRDNVIIVNDPSSNSTPQKKDWGLILSVGNFDYYIGKVEKNYQQKIEGMSPERLKDAEGNPIYTKEVKPGEVLLTTIAKGVELFLSRGGNFWLKHRNKDGISYKVAQRMLEIAGTIITMSGAGVNVAFGRVMRNRKGLGLESIPSDAGPFIPALEALIEVVAQQKIKVARLHLGHIKNPLDPTGAVDEVGSWGGRLRAILEAGMGPTKSAVKIDETGNIDVAAAPTMQAVLSGLLVNLGAFNATEFLIKGTSYVTSETEFTTAEATFIGEHQKWMTAFTAFLTTMGTAFSAILTPADASIKLPPVGAAATALVSTFGVPYATAIGKYVAAISKYSGELPTKLSTVTKTT